MSLRSRLLSLIAIQWAIALLLEGERGWIVLAMIALVSGGVWWYLKRPSRAERHVVTMLGDELHVSTPEGTVRTIAIADIDELVIEGRMGAYDAIETWWVLIGSEPGQRCEFPLLATGSESFDTWLDTLEGVDNGAYPEIDAKEPSRAVFWRRASDWKAPERPPRPEPEATAPSVSGKLKEGAKFAGFGALSSVVLLRALGMEPGKPIFIAAAIAFVAWSVLVWLATRRTSPGDGWTLTLSEGRLEVTDDKGRAQSLSLADVREVALVSRRNFVHGWHKVWIVDGSERCDFPEGTTNGLDILEWLCTQPGFDKAADDAAIERYFKEGRSDTLIVWKRP